MRTRLWLVMPWLYGLIFVVGIAWGFNAHAQSVQAAECSNGCNFAADVPRSAALRRHSVAGLHKFAA